MFSPKTISNSECLKSHYFTGVITAGSTLTFMLFRPIIIAMNIRAKLTLQHIQKGQPVIGL
jgi:hypothetical protein